MTTKKIILASASALGLLASLHSPALAQDSVSDAPQAEDSQTAYGDIIVTAQKREEKLSDVGITIAAIGAAQLAERSIQSLADVAAAVPGLSYINSANNTPVYNLRGVGFYDTSLGSYPTTSVYVDQVPLPFPVLTNLTAFDLQRIEVLKGPQGTLFGQNSTGGAINYIANKPSRDFEAGFEASYGRFDQIIGNGYVSGPLGDTVRARLALRVEDSGPWQQSYTRDDQNGRAENYAGRVLIDWDASDTLKFELNLNGWVDKNEPQAVQYTKFNNQPSTPTNVSPAVRNYPLSPQRPRAADWSDENGMFRDLRFLQGSLRGDWEFATDIVLTSITSYVDFTQDGALDQDGINFQDIDLGAFTGDVTSFSQELRIANTDAGPFRWIVGGNYSRDHVFYRENLLYGEGSGGNNFDPAQPQGAFFAALAGRSTGIEVSENFSDQKMKNYAAFGNAEYDLGDKLTVKAGVRYTKAERTADICNLDGSLPEGTIFGPSTAARGFRPGGVNALFDVLAHLGATGGLPPPGGPFAYPRLQPGQCFNLNDTDPRNPLANPARPFEPTRGVFTSSINEDNISWRLGVDFKPSDDILLYANVAKGYKAGGFGNINAAINFQFRPVVQESILNYEAGIKAQLADRRVSVNAAVFYMDYQNKQLRTKDINPVFGIIDALNNVPKSRLQGAELEVQVTPADGLNLGIAATFIDSKISEYSGTSAVGVTADFAGTEIPFTPKWQVGANLRYEVPVSDTLKAFAGGQLNYRNRTWAAIGGHPDPARDLASDFKVKGYTTVDAQLGIKSDDNWRVMVWGKNLGSTYYWTNVVAGQDQIVRYVQKPATYGITVGFDF